MPTAYMIWRQRSRSIPLFRYRFAVCLPGISILCSILFMCYACGALLPYGYKPGFNDTCEQCGKDLHICQMCRFYTPGLHWDCAENIDEQVFDKEKRNHCEWFSAAEKFVENSSTDRTVSQSDAKRKFDALFGD